MDKPLAAAGVGDPWRLTDPVDSTFLFKPPETPREPLEFLSRSWSISALQVSRALAPPKSTLSKSTLSAATSCATILEDLVGETADEPALSSAAVTGNPFSFTSNSQTSQLILESIMSQSEVSPRTSGRLSLSSGPLYGSELRDSPPVSPSVIDDIKIPVPRLQQPPDPPPQRLPEEVPPPHRLNQH